MHILMPTLNFLASDKVSRQRMQKSVQKERSPSASRPDYKIEIIIIIIIIIISISNNQKLVFFHRVNVYICYAQKPKHSCFSRLVISVEETRHKQRGKL